jgi:hypothetical protein
MEFMAGLLCTHIDGLGQEHFRWAHWNKMYVYNG